MVDPLLDVYIKKELIKPSEDHRQEVFDNPDLLEGAAGIWRGSEHILKAVIRARIARIQHEIVTEAVPQELLLLRQAMVEVAFLFDDFEAYARESERRKKEADGSGKQEGLSPPVGALAAPDNAELDSGNHDMSSM